MSAAEPAEGESKKILQVVVAWSEFSLAIQTSHQEGTILPPLEEEKEEPAQPKALTEQLEYFNGLNPEELGLEGDDMHDYTVYPKTGWVLVDSFSCRELNIYLEDALNGTNVFMGTFYLSSDLQRLWRIFLLSPSAGSAADIFSRITVPIRVSSSGSSASIRFSRSVTLNPCSPPRSTPIYSAAISAGSSIWL